MQVRSRWQLVILAAGVASGPAWADTKVAVVNVATLSEKYAKTKDLESQFDALRKSLGQQREAMKEKIERAKAALQEELKPGTEEFLQRRKEIAMMEAELQWFVESEGQKVEKGLAQALRSIFDDIHVVVQELADEEGIQVVLAADNVPAEAPDTPNQARQTILLQKVLYWKPETDMTDAVLTRLNQRYRPGSGAGLGAATPNGERSKAAAVTDKPKSPAAAPSKTPAKPTETKRP
jgi:Skp family chaperone for outer membrane proteins